MSTEARPIPRICSITRRFFHRRKAGVVMLSLLLGFVHQGASADQLLVAGDWKGTFLSHDGTRYKIAYRVSYSGDTADEAVNVSMIYLDLEPRSEFTYDLSDIEISKKKLKFKIVKEFETKQCSLKFKKARYSGTCTSSVGNANEVSEITMVPPQPEAGAE